MPILFTIYKHRIKIMMFGKYRMIIQACIQQCLITGSSLICNSGIICHIFSDSIRIRLEIIRTIRYFRFFIKLIIILQTIIYACNQSFHGFPIQIKRSIQFLPVFLLQLISEETQWIKCLRVFTIRHHTTINIQNRVIRINTCNSTLHI